MPSSILEQAIRNLQSTAQRHGKTTVRVHDTLRAINELLVQSSSNEIAVDLPLKDAIRATRRRQDGPIDGVGVHGFEYNAKNKGVLRELALALRYTRSERGTQTGDDVPSVTWVPLVPLRGSGAPTVASQRLRLWAGQNLPYLVALLSDAMAKQVQSIAATANHTDRGSVAKKGT